MNSGPCTNNDATFPTLIARFRSDLDSEVGYNSDSLSAPLRGNNQLFAVNSRGSAVRRGLEKGSLSFFRSSKGQSFKLQGTSDESDPNLSTIKKNKNSTKYLDPAGKFLYRWNTFFVATSLVAVFVDPLFYYLFFVDNENNCVAISDELKKSVTAFRTMTDTLYMIHMFLQFKTAFVAPSSRVFGRGELVTDPKKIAARYLRKDFWVDLAAVLPIPQVRDVTSLVRTQLGFRFSGS